MSTEDTGDDWAAAMAEQALEEANAIALDELVDDSQPISKAEAAKLDTILDIPVTISMEVGRSFISIRNLLQLNQGSVVELDRQVREPADLLLDGRLIARGEVVVVDGNYGLRVIEIVSPPRTVGGL